MALELRVRDAVVVTEEGPGGGNKIPDVCRAENIECASCSVVRMPLILPQHSGGGDEADVERRGCDAANGRRRGGQEA